MDTYCLECKVSGNHRLKLSQIKKKHVEAKQVNQPTNGNSWAVASSMMSVSSFEKAVAISALHQGI